MSLVWDKVIPFSEQVISKFDTAAVLDLSHDYTIESENFTWKNYLFQDSNYRRAHIEIVDAREYKKIWVMHMTIFPYYDDPSPIFGFDVVCGANKITGAFHDFSKVDSCRLYNKFQRQMAMFPKFGLKARVLPEWANNIFSPNILALGNITENEDIDRLLTTSIANLDLYMYNVGMQSTNSYITAHDYYCKNQKLNHHTPAMMETIGVDPTLFKRYMDDTLFPEYHGT